MLARDRACASEKLSRIAHCRAMSLRSRDTFPPRAGVIVIGSGALQLMWATHNGREAGSKGNRAAARQEAIRTADKWCCAVSTVRLPLSWH